jgi:abortive infection bacteriophage resistance protein
MGYYYRFILTCIQTQYTTRERSFFEILIAKYLAKDKITQEESDLLITELDVQYGSSAI